MTDTWDQRATRNAQMMQNRCVCGKVGFPDKQDAIRQIRRYAHAARRSRYYVPGQEPGNIPKRAYYCDLGNVWHTTKKRAVEDASPFMLPAPPHVPRRADDVEAWWTVAALALRGGIERQGVGLAFPSTDRLVQHYLVHRDRALQIRNLLLELGWLRWDRESGRYLTSRPR